MSGVWGWSEALSAYQGVCVVWLWGPCFLAICSGFHLVERVAAPIVRECLVFRGVWRVACEGTSRGVLCSWFRVDRVGWGVRRVTS